MNEFPVQLYRYDLSQGMARAMSMMLIGEQLDGIWHTAIVAYGKEFYYNGGVGIDIVATPGGTTFGTPQLTELLGTTTKTLEEFLSWVSQQRRVRFGPNNYNLLANNCNHFTQEACQFLLGCDIPEDIRDMIPRVMRTPLGQMISPMMAPAASTGSLSSFGSSPLSMNQNLSLGQTENGVPTSHQLGSKKSAITEEEEESLLLSRIMLETCDPPLSDSEKTSLTRKIEAATLLNTIVQNIVDYPDLERYRKISTNSVSYKTKLLPFEEFGVVEILKICGFRLCKASVEANLSWELHDGDASKPVLERVAEELCLLVSILESEAERAKCTLARDIDFQEDAIFKFCVPPYSDNYIPLNINPESHHQELFSILKVGGGRENHCFGKCRFSRDLSHLQAWICNEKGLAEDIESSAYAVLCVRKGFERRALWISSSLAQEKDEEGQSTGAASFIFHPTEHFGIIRSFVKNQAHPGVMEPSGRCFIPYGKTALEVTQEAQVLCDREKVPREIVEMAEKQYEGEKQLSALQQLAGFPFTCLDALCSCFLEHSDLPYGTVPPLQPLDHEAMPNPSERTKLLVCHDYNDGYLRGDYPFFSCNPSSAVINEVYTPEYWRLIDYFVYFSHARVTVPPREWVHLGHKNGVPVLGTLFFEGAEACGDFEYLTTNPKRMALTITSLVALCNRYGFDGYLLNFEIKTSEKLAKRALTFCASLRAGIREGKEHEHRSIIWYDAMTIGGDLNFQNQLSSNNQPFFEKLDGILLNYFWRPDQLNISSQMCNGKRNQDCFVGVDVFGRRMRHGGKYACDLAVAEIQKASLSVGLFAPGWTLECEGHGRRHTYLTAEARLWSSLQPFFMDRPPLLITSLPLYTCFTSGAGELFSVNGTAIAVHSPWAQISAAHRLPPFHFSNMEHPKQKHIKWRSQLILLPLRMLQEEGDTPPSVVPSVEPIPAFWVYGYPSGDASVSNSHEMSIESGSYPCWFGDRALEIDIPPRGHVELLHWSTQPLASFAVDIVLSAQNHSLSTADLFAACGILVHTASSTTGVDQVDAPSWLPLAHKNILHQSSQWVVIRCFSSEPHVVHTKVLGVSLCNFSREVLPCRVGGVALVSAEDVNSLNGESSPLIAPGACLWPNASLSPTSLNGEYLICLPHVSRVSQSVTRSLNEKKDDKISVALVATVSYGDNCSRRNIFLGIHTVDTAQEPDRTLFIPLSEASENIKLIEVNFMRISEGF